MTQGNTYGILVGGLAAMTVTNFEDAALLTPVVLQVFCFTSPLNCPAVKISM